MTDGGRGPEHGQNTLVSKTCSFMLDNGGREGRWVTKAGFNQQRAATTLVIIIT